MSEEWITFNEAVDIVRAAHQDVGIGRSEAVTRAALASGEVRFHGHPGAPVVFTTPQGNIDFSMRPRVREKISKDDLVDWLSRLPRPTPTSTAASATPKARSRNKRDRVGTAIEALWPNGLPDPAVLENVRLCRQVEEWLKVDCKERSVPVAVISSDTILRAAGRK